MRMAIVVNKAVWYHPKYEYHDTIALVSRYTLGIDSYMIWLIWHNQANVPVKFRLFII